MQWIAALLGLDDYRDRRDPTKPDQSDVTAQIGDQVSQADSGPDAGQVEYSGSGPCVLPSI